MAGAAGGAQFIDLGIGTLVSGVDPAHDGARFVDFGRVASRGLLGRGDLQFNNVFANDRLQRWPIV
jgi:hypothetical protein